MLATILVTGATGFVGQVLCEQLLQQGFTVRAAVRQLSLNLDPKIEQVVVGDWRAQPHWDQAIHGITTIIHLAARVHVMHDKLVKPLNEYRKINVDVTKHLATAAANANVKRFIFISTIRVNGENTGLMPDGSLQKFTEQDMPHPQDPYAQSKYEAEQILQEIAATNNLETVIIRPPLVYGAGAKANFMAVVSAIKYGWPLPLGGINNCRSLIYVKNLVDAIITCIESPAVCNQIYLVSDGDNVSTPELIKRLGIALGKPARLLSVPASLIRFIGMLIGQQERIERLFSCLVIDNSKIYCELGKPPYKMQQALQQDFSSITY